MFFTHADVVGMGTVFASVCLCVCFFSQDIRKTDTAGITKRDIEMFHGEFWESFYCG